MTRLSLLPPAALAAVLVAIPAGPARGCGAVWRGDPVAIADEAALIVWDSASQTEHFIRRSTFKTDSTDFGFLVPTPTKPEIAEADDRAFHALETWTAPQVIYDRRGGNAETGGGCGCSKSSRPPDPLTGAAPAAAKVDVLEEKRVGTFDAAVLKADDPAALVKWLTDHGYQSRPAVERWLQWYADNGWVITAFKIAKKPDAARTNAVSTSSVRLSFKTDKPFYPYREPDDAKPAGPAPPRLLRVYFASDGRYDGSLGAAGLWPAATVWSGDLAGKAETLLKTLKLPAGTLPADAWLTEFEDRSSPRPGTDEVFFAKAPRNDAVRRPPVHVMAATLAGGRGGTPPMGPMTAILTVALAGYTAWRLRPRRALGWQG